MSALRRLGLTLQAQFDWMVSQVENHEAVVNAAIAEVNHTQAAAKVRFANVKRDGERLRSRERELAQATVSWRERALELRATDEAKALECVRRLQRAEADRLVVEKEIQAHRDLEAQLEEDLKLIAARLDDLKRKRNVLRTRESRATALRASHLDDTGLIGELDRIIERWEVKVTEAEALSECLAAPVDPFEEGFTQADETAALQAALAALSPVGETTENR